MKKLLLITTVIALTLSVLALTVSAEPASLLPEDASVWKSNSANGEDASIKIEGGATVIFGSANSWPSANYSMEENDWITIPTEDYVLEYDFSLDIGHTNMTLFLKGNTPDNYTDGTHFSIVNCIDGPKDEGSGDLFAGTYTGAIKIEDMINQEGFPKDTINDDNTLTVSGLRVFTVFGANVKINKLEFVEASESNIEESSADSEDEDETSSEDIVSEDIISEDAADESDISEADTDDSADLSEDDTDDSDDKSEDDKSNGLDTIWYIVIIAAAVILIVIVAIIIAKKKK